MLGLVVGSATAIAQPATAIASNQQLAAVSGLAVVSTGPPQTYSYWTLPPSSGKGYDRLYQTVTPNNMPLASPGQAVPAYFYATQWYNASNLSDGGYVGLQTDSQGKKAIFSWWGATTGYGPGISRPFSGEGVGWQNIISYNWQAGHAYRLTVNHGSTTTTGMWFTATILDVQSNRSSTIGSVQIPTSFGGIYEYINNFVEWYGPTQSACTSYPISDVTFSAPHGRDRVGTPTVTAAPGIPPSGTPNGPACSGVTDNVVSMQHVNGTP
jgi:hypothetical protein